MNERPTIVLLGASRPRQALVTSILENVATVTTSLPGLSGVPAAASKIRIVLVDLAGPDPNAALKTLEDVRTTVPGVQLVALGASKDPELILRAMRAGAREFVVLSTSGELAGVVTALVRRASQEQPGGTILSIFPAKGGMGATTLATNLAAFLCREGKRVLLVDFDRQLGDVLVFLDMTPRYTIPEVLQNLHRLDRELLLSSLARHDSGVYVLTHARFIEDAESLGPSQILSLLQFVSRHFDYVVCDGLGGFDEISVAVLDASTRIELLLAQDVPSLRNAKHCLDVFNRLGYAETKVNLVVSRFQKTSTIDLPFIAENLGRDVRYCIANDYRSAASAVNRGVLLSEAAPRSKLTEDIANLATQVSGGAPAKPPGGFLRTLFGRSQPPSKPEPVTQANNNDKDEGSYDESRRAPETS